MKSYSYNMQPPVPSIQQNSSNQAVVVGNTILGLSGISIFICLILGAILYKRRRIYRTHELCQQIEMLERMWRLPSKR